ncbi:plasmid partitioning protein RepB [Pontitalea aquivivens]|uniref:plasmid partitioning protein RepB n=1 Tax=Pontitalea aquivivens TaxID=3388663 RepID=UPI003970DD5B
MSRKDAINSLFLGKTGAASSGKASPARDPERVRSGAIGAMGVSLKELTQGAREAAKLQEQLNSGEHVVLLSPDQIDSSPIADRLPADNDPSYQALRDSIEANGQQIPILVRPSPTAEGRYQVAYGRRRLRVAAELGREVRAIIQALTDAELVVAQGRENLDRSDLSFIERALFAKHLEDAGYERSVLIAALSVDKSDLSRYISIARRVPEVLARQIGPAPKVGRARWVQLVDALAKTKFEERVDRIVQTDEFARADSDARFALVLKSLLPPTKRQAKVHAWNTPNGKEGARLLRQGNKTSITFDERHAPEFATFIAERLDGLYEEFTTTKESDQPKT